MTALRYVDPMGIYETLFAFQNLRGHYMGSVGTHPYMQGFPLVTQIPGAPAPLTSVSFEDPQDRMYPKAEGKPELRTAIANYYATHYGAKLDEDNVMVFAGGRPGLFAVLLFLDPKYRIAIEETEYTPYWDVLKLLGRKPLIVESNEQNRFLTSLSDYLNAQADDRICMVKSNPTNPTGVVWGADELEKTARQLLKPGFAALFDEAYEMMVSPEPDSILRYVADINQTDLFVAGAATKGLQFPGARLGWVVASKENIEVLRNFSSFGMGGVSHPSQNVGIALLEPKRVAQARLAVSEFYGYQRERYAELLSSLGVELFTGRGGFYHWCKLPNGLLASEFNSRLMNDDAAILEGRFCDMLRREENSPMAGFFRFSFGPLAPESFEEDAQILRRALS